MSAPRTTGVTIEHNGIEWRSQRLDRTEYRHCECGCGEQLAGRIVWRTDPARINVAGRRAAVWYALNEGHAAKIAARLQSVPFEYGTRA